MKKRFLILLICALTVILPSCGETITPVIFEPYTDFNGIDTTASVQLDSGVTLDGVLDEQIWKESKTAINIPGATKDQTTKETIDVKIIPYNEMTYDIIKLEGEDENLESWKYNHEKFFKEDGRISGYEFSEDMLVVFEIFKVIKVF